MADEIIDIDMDIGDREEFLRLREQLDAAATELLGVNTQLEALNRRAVELRDLIENARTGIRIKGRAIQKANDLPETAELVIDTTAKTVEIVNRVARNPRRM